MTTPPSRGGVALVLSGGAVKGVSHLGVLKVLQEAAIPIDFMVGVSAGAALGASYSDTQSANISYRLVRKLWPASYDYSIMGLPKVRDGVAGHGFFSVEGLKKIFTKVLQRDKIEDLPIPIHIVATELSKGKQYVFSSGSLIDAICASLSIPIFFKPFRIGEKEYVDVGIISDLPVAVARNLGATVVIACNVAILVKEEESKSNMWYKTWAIIQKRAREEEEKKADILIQPDINTNPKLFASKEELDLLYEGGQKAALEALPAIKELIRKK